MERAMLFIFSLLICLSCHEGTKTSDCIAPTESLTQRIVSSQRLRTTVGHQTTLPCQTSLSNDVDWIFQQTNSSQQAKCIFLDGHLVNGYNTVFGIDNAVQGDYSLVILKTLMNYTGLYTCVENGGVGSIHRVYLNVADVPTVRTFAVNHGENVRLPCRSSFTTMPVNWIYENPTKPETLRICTSGQIDSMFSARFRLGKLDAGDNTLIIYDVHLNESGKYTCIENEGRGGQHHMRLIVLDIQRNIVSTAGSTVELGCIIFTGLRTTWNFKQSNSTNPVMLYDGYNLSKVSQHKPIEVLVVSDRYLNVLSIRHVQSEDSGRYTCSPGDDVANLQSYELVVLGSELWCNISAINYSVPSSENFVIQCEIKYTGNIHPTVVCSHGHMTNVVLKQRSGLFTNSIPLSDDMGELSCNCRAVFNASYNRAMLLHTLTWTIPNVLQGTGYRPTLPITSTTSVTGIVFGILFGLVLVAAFVLMFALLCKCRRRSEFTSVPQDESKISHQKRTQDAKTSEEGNYAPVPNANETSSNGNNYAGLNENNDAPERPLPSPPDQSDEQSA